ncbi:MAG: hypothetical protein H6867_04225 [Rhodospirillales bacterium]|nr:hypothetical protein [Rhodospirillales bacterium]MCB9996356.1 hypothetical protein [Rhodospirillales bacterium]
MRNAFLQQSRARKFGADAILAQKMTRLRQALANVAHSDKPFHESAFIAFADNLRELCTDKRGFERQYALAKAALTDKTAQKMPDLSCPEYQLLWAAACLNIRNGTPSLPYSGLWRQLVASPDAKKILDNHNIYIAEELQRPQIRFSWGKPEEGFGYDPKEKTIRVDLLMSMISGFEHAHGLMIREVGHHLLSTSYPEKNRELIRQIKALKEKEDKKELSNEGYKKMRMLGLELEMRRQLWDVAERAVASRFAERKGAMKAQDYAYSLNHYLMTNTHFGYTALEDFRERQRDNQMQDLARAALEEIKGQFAGEAGESIPPEMKALFEQQVRQLENMVSGSLEERFMNILHTVELAFYKNNGLFAHDRESWERFGVNVQQVKAGKGKGFNIPGHGRRTGPDELPADFDYLVSLCSDLEILQPRPGDKQQNGRNYYRGALNSYAAQRNAIIEKIWEIYVEDIAHQLKQDLEDEIDQEMGNDPQQRQDQDQDDNQQGGDPSSSENADPSQQQSDSTQQEGDASRSQENAPQNQGESSQQQGDPSQQQGEPSQSQGEPSQSQGEPSQSQGEPSQSQGEQQGEGQSQDFGPEEKPFGDARKEEKNATQDQKFDASSAGTDPSGSKVDVTNDKGKKQKMPDVPVPEEHPEGHEPGQDADGQGADGQSQSNSDEQGGQGKDGQSSEKKPIDPKTLEQIRKEIEEMLKKQQEEMEQQKGEDGAQSDADGDGADSDGQDGEGQDGPGENGKKEGQSSSGAGDGGEPKTLEDIAISDWKNYPMLVSQLQTYIVQTARLFEKIRDKQIEKTVQRSPDLEMLPEGKEMDRFNREAHQNLVTKKVTGQQIEKEDLHRFHKDEQHQKPTTIDIVLMIDGSGSMVNAGVAYKVGKADPMEIALISSIILHEAAKKVDANVYVALWGNDDPIILAKPGDDPRQVGENLLRARKGMNCGTNLAPSIKKITKVLSEHKSGKYSGYTHMMVISDGDISDPVPATKAINTLLSTSDYTTLEFAVLKKPGFPAGQPAGLDQKTAMEKVADDIRVANPAQKIGVHRDGDPNSIPAGIVGLIFQKIRTMESFAAVPWAKKRKQFQRANTKFDVR